jgi:RNA polymerase sigma factor (sigma-70 family)
MAKAVPSPILQLVRRIVLDQRVRESDRDLLERFDGQRDEAAFHALVLRHGPMVLAVCREMLGNEADAEDAFQATFLILARKSPSIRKAASVGSWLHGVAYRTALKARAQSATRQQKESRVPARQASEPDGVAWREIRQVLHQELSGLAERYRAPLVLCYLEGKTQDAAAAQLGMATRTLKERLERGRSLLRARLVRRGLGPAAVLLAAAWPFTTAFACLPAALVSRTGKVANLFVAGQTGATPVNVAALTEGILNTMLLTKIKVASVVLLLIGLLGAGVGLLTHRTQASPQVRTHQPEERKQNREVVQGDNRIPQEEGDRQADGNGLILFAQSRSGPSRLASIRLGDMKETLLGEPLDPLKGFEDGFRLSPNGKQVAYRLHKRTAGETKYAIHIRNVNPAGNPVDMQVDGQEVCWSGDGKQIAVARGESGNVLVDVTTKKQTALKLPEGHWITDWSPDGTWFLVQFRTEKEKWQLARMKIGDSKIQKLPGTEGGVYGGRISPDGKSVLFDRLAEKLVSTLWVYSLEDGKTRQITQDQNGFVRGYSWSPSGKRIAYTWVRFDPESAKDPRFEQETEAFLSVNDIDGKSLSILLSEPTGGISAVHLSFWDWR